VVENYKDVSSGFTTEGDCQYNSDGNYLEWDPASATGGEISLSGSGLVLSIEYISMRSDGAIFPVCNYYLDGTKIGDTRDPCDYKETCTEGGFTTYYSDNALRVPEFQFISSGAVFKVTCETTDSGCSTSNMGSNGIFTLFNDSFGIIINIVEVVLTSGFTIATPILEYMYDHPCIYTGFEMASFLIYLT
jgi:hypothetical protein